MSSCDEAGFCGIGRWAGTAEVFDGHGKFLGNASDQRHVRTVASDGRIKIDLAFVGPLKFAGHYFISDHGQHRTYEGPANYGFAEAVSSQLVDANGFWPLTGLSQQFFLMMLPDGSRQLSLSLMSRGERLYYAIVSENHLQNKENDAIPGLVNGISADLVDDPSAGRGEILLHRPGRWEGTLAFKDAKTGSVQENPYHEVIKKEGDFTEMTKGGGKFDLPSEPVLLKGDGYQFVTKDGGILGTQSLYGGRASAGTFHAHGLGLRVRQREVVANDGEIKVIVQNWYKGHLMVGTQYGVLCFIPE